jgi:hypothetical protein
MGRSVALPGRTVSVEAAAELTYQVVSSAGQTRERRGVHERVVEFHIEVRGRPVVTTELVRLDPPYGIYYRWLEGPLPAVEERIEVTPVEAHRCELRYRGRFETPHGGIVGIVEGWMIRRTFDRAVRDHLYTAKQLAEERAKRSKLFWRARA